MATDQRRARMARNLLFVSVAGVLALAYERPARGSVKVVGDEVLAQVPARGGREGRAIERLRADPNAKLELARAYIEASRRDGDPRYLGLAEGALLGAPRSSEARVLRATILQSRHEFPAALAELDQVLANEEDAQARLTQATVRTVLADYERARESCRALPPSIHAIACTAAIDALTGEQERARQALEQALTRARSERAWLHSLLGEQAYWQGDEQRAERELRASLALEDDRYTRALLADLLLDQRRPVEGNELHRALAELGRGVEGEAVRSVEAAFADSQARGDRVHQREESRFWLARGDRARALACARENWQVQREPWDARVLLEAASTRAEAAPALDWLARTGFASPRLRALAARLEAL